jgi:hypothetical protein
MGKAADYNVSEGIVAHALRVTRLRNRYPHSYIKEQDMTNFNMSRAPGRTYRYYTGAFDTTRQHLDPVHSFQPQTTVYVLHLKPLLQARRCTPSDMVSASRRSA